MKKNLIQVIIGTGLILYAFVAEAYTPIILLHECAREYGVDFESIAPQNCSYLINSNVGYFWIPIILLGLLLASRSIILLICMAISKN